MHEIGLIEGLIKSIEEKTKAGSSRVEKVYVKMGRKMELSEESLRFWFGNLSKGTSLEGAVLDILVVDDNGIFVDSVEIANEG